VSLQRDLEISISPNLRSSIPGASLIVCTLVVSAGAPPPPPLPPPPKYCFKPVSKFIVPDPPSILNILDSNVLM
jgi:hypothetical protein